VVNVIAEEPDKRFTPPIEFTRKDTILSGRFGKVEGAEVKFDCPDCPYIEESKDSAPELPVATAVAT